MSVDQRIQRIQTPDGHSLALSERAVTLDFEPGTVLSREIWVLEIRQALEEMVGEHRKQGLPVCSEAYLAGVDAFLRIVNGEQD